MQSIDSTIVNTAIPIIAQHFSAEPLNLHPVLTAYVLALAVCIPATPWLCERYGTKLIFGSALAIFTLGSFLCGFSFSIPQLIAARIVQGIGGAALLPVGRYVMIRSLPRDRLIGSISTVATLGLVGATIGPFAGGFLSQFISWRIVFLINIPIGLAAIAMNTRWMVDYKSDDRHPFDTIGFFIFGFVIASLLWNSEGISSPDIYNFLSFIPILALSFIYVVWSRRSPRPIVDLRLLENRSVSIALLGNLFARLGISGMFLILVVFLQLGCGWSPALAGLMLVPQAIGSIVAKKFVDSLLKRAGYRIFLTINTLLVAACLSGFALFDRQAGVIAISGYVFVYGILTGLQFTVMNTLIYTDIAEADIPMASSMASTMQYLSMSFGIAAGSIMMALLLPEDSAAGYTHAFQKTVVFLGIFTLLASGLFATLRAPNNQK